MARAAGDDIDKMALEYHRAPPAGKISVTPTKPLANQRDLALAYSPGVAAACRAIIDDPGEARTLTARGNLVAVVSNGTAVLGLGAIGPLAAKPVMEGKAVLFKKFAGIDVFDIEIAENDPLRLVEIIAALEPTFGGINLEDIKAPECFVVERELRRRMKIPVFHDDQHGTAICVGAAMRNGLRVVGKRIADVKLVCAGAGAAALACLDQLVVMGLRRENVTVADLAGVVYAGRTELMDEFKARYARPTEMRTLAEACVGADVFLGLSAGGVLQPEMVATMAARPLILALANPTPEILPELAHAVRPDAVLATGRSDYPNQVNNVLCFPFLFRGALDVGATAVTEEMKLAAIGAIADLALAEPSDVVARAYGGEQIFSFGADYFIPKPFDPRLIVHVAAAVAEAAMKSKVATRPIRDLKAYRESLTNFVFRTGFIMRPLFERARARPLRLAFAEGEDERVLRAAQIVVEDGVARPILVGRRQAIMKAIARLGLRLRPGEDVTLVDLEGDQAVPAALPADATVVAAMLVRRGEADAMLCGALGGFDEHVRRVVDIIGLQPGAAEPHALQVLVMPQGYVFVADSNIARDPTAEGIAGLTVLAAAEVRRFGLTPKVALVSHSNFGASDSPSAAKMRQALARVRALAPDLEIDGEMKADAALSPAIRDQVGRNSKLSGAANLLIMPNLDAANISVGLVRQMGEGLAVGPIMLGLARSAHVVSTTITVRGLVNMSAVAVVHAQDAQNAQAGAAAARSPAAP